MAQLNVSLPGSAADIGSSLNASRGMNLSSTSGAVATGLGDVVKVAATTMDNANKIDISEQLRAELTTTRDMTIGSLASQNPDSRMRPPPKEVADATEKWSKMAEAKGIGAMPESYYWQLMDTSVRSVRARYPSYAEFIDQEASRITGHVPANKLASELRQEAQANASDGQKRDDAAFKMAFGSPEFNDAYARGLDPKRFFTTLEKEKIASRNAGLKFKLEEAKTSFEITEVNDKSAVRAVENDVNRLMPEFVKQTLGRVQAMDPERRDVFKLAEIMLTTPDGPEKVKAQQTLDIAVAALQTEFEKNVDKEIMDKPIMFGGKETTRRAIVGTSEKVNALRGELRKHFAEIADSIKAKDIKSLQRLKDRNEALTTTDAHRLITSSPNIRSVAAVASIPGGQAIVPMVAAKVFIDANKDLGVFQKEIVSSSIGDRSRTAKEIGRTFTEQGIPGGTKAAVNSMKEAILLPQAPEEMQRNAAHNLFSTPGRDFIEDITSPKDRLRVFSEIASPAMTAKVKQLDAKEPGLFSRYQGWVTRNMLELGRQTVNTTIETMKSAIKESPSVTMSFNQETGRFQTSLGASTERGLARDRAVRDYTRLNAQVQEANSLMNALVPVYKEAYGKSGINQLVEDFKNNLGVDLGTLGVAPPSEKAQDRLGATVR